MTIQDAATLRSYFEAGDRPTQSEFIDLIDSIFGVSVLWSGTATGTADAIVLTPDPAVETLSTGTTLRFKSSGVNTGTVTIAVSELAGVTVVKNGTALVGGDIPADAIVTVVFIGTEFDLVGVVASNFGVSLVGANEASGAVNLLAPAVRTGRQLLYNGAMRAHRLGTSFTGIGASTVEYNLEEWVVHALGAPTARVSALLLPTDFPGFPAFLRLDCTTSQGSVGADDLFALDTSLIAEETALLRYGFASAEPLALQFRVRSPKVGIHCVALFRPQESRSFIREYNVTSANTDELITVFFPGDVGGGIIPTTLLEGLRVTWPLMAGTDFQRVKDQWAAGNEVATVNQQNLLDSAANNFDIVGAKLEIGSIPTPYEHYDWMDDFRRCGYFVQKTYNNTDLPGALSEFGALSTSSAGTAANTVNFTWQYPYRLRSFGGIISTISTIYNPITGTVGEMRAAGGTNVAGVTQVQGEHNARITNTATTIDATRHRVHAVAISRMR